MAKFYFNVDNDSPANSVTPCPYGMRGRYGHLYMVGSYLCAFCQYNKVRYYEYEDENAIECIHP